ncbi:MAG TPA: fibrobacter succinogenes major paralogous domain-containing protein [Bacteroidales bacterium]|nr:fibrobacter succinogenes major paralogous domain-containing protein [Bacteroidales bacterium]
MKKLILQFAVLALLIIKTQAQTVTDIDGNVYNIVNIGTQVWMAENLRVTKYKDGTAIPLVSNETSWAYLTSPGFCWYLNNDTTYGDIYGALYNWYAVNTAKLCPAGWHVPRDAEWTELANYLGGLSVAGGKLKETGTEHWASPNTGATNETYFTALPGGSRTADGSFSAMGSFGIFWSTDTVSAAHAKSRALSFNNDDMTSNINLKTQGVSVRCLCDLDAQINEIKNNIEIDITACPQQASQNIN